MNAYLDKNITSVTEIPTPREVMQETPLSPRQQAVIGEFRTKIEDILDGRDTRLIAVVGPCAIHDIEGATVFAQKLSSLAHELEDDLLIIMRVYFEKPRGTCGWKGLINDPYLNDSFRMEDGLRVARKFLMHLVKMELPAATEALDPIIPEYLGDMFSWMAIGQRTVESNAHREMASGLSMPVGFKNAPGKDGIQTAINAIKTASRPNRFLGISIDGALAVLETKGNDYSHIILRGGDSPNYGRFSIAETDRALSKAGLPIRIVVDCSHGNSESDPQNQAEVLADVLAQIENGNNSIVGFMLESYLEWGCQTLKNDPDDMDYGVSITDPCIDWDTTERLLRDAAERFSRVKANY